MKLAICHETYGERPFPEVCADVARCGYDALELAPFLFADDPTSLDLGWAEETRRIADDHGLAICGLHWLLVRPEGLHLTARDPAVRQRTVRFAQQLAELLAALGGDVLVWGSPAQRGFGPDETYADAFGRAVEGVRAVAETAGELGVTVAMEPLSPRLTNFLNTAEQARELMVAVDHPACRLHLDVSAMCTESLPIPDLVREHQDHLVHFHANDPNRRGPGTGDVDFTPILAALREIGYEGYVSVEVFDYRPDPETIARESIAYLSRVLASLEAR